MQRLPEIASEPLGHLSLGCSYERLTALRLVPRDGRSTGNGSSDRA